MRTIVESIVTLDSCGGILRNASVYQGLDD